MQGDEDPQGRFFSFLFEYAVNTNEEGNTKNSVTKSPLLEKSTLFESQSLEV